jgi:hypothetical protein
MKKRLYPSKLKINGVSYDLVLSRALDPTDPPDEQTRGYCETQDKQIFLDETLSEKELFSTFWHEVLHALVEEHGIKLKHKTVYALEGPIAEFIKDNFVFFPKR